MIYYKGLVPGPLALAACWGHLRERHRCTHTEGPAWIVHKEIFTSHFFYKLSLHHTLQDKKTNAMRKTSRQMGKNDRSVFYRTVKTWEEKPSQTFIRLPLGRNLIFIRYNQWFKLYNHIQPVLIICTLRVCRYTYWLSHSCKLQNQHPWHFHGHLWTFIEWPKIWVTWCVGSQLRWNQEKLCFLVSALMLETNGLFTVSVLPHFSHFCVFAGDFFI